VADNALAAEVRSGTGKGVARKLRVEGRIPAVIYGKGRESRAVSVDARALERLLQASGAGLNTLIDLQLDGGTQVVLVKELQREPVRGGTLHADFYAVDLTRTVEVSVPLDFVGKARGIEYGGILDLPLREVLLECLPRAIPDQIEVDVSGLDMGQSLHVRDLVLPEGVTVKSDPDLAVATVVAPRAEEEVAPAAVVAEGEAAAEPGAAAPGEAGGGEES
jgi:large subunit ribosomal protein L25